MSGDCSFGDDEQQSKQMASEEDSKGESNFESCPSDGLAELDSQCGYSAPLTACNDVCEMRSVRSVVRVSN